MRTRDLVRTVILRTNPYWPFSRLNRLPYHLAISAFISLCKRYSEIKSLYLRHGLLHSDWVPGISDIDFTVVFAGDLNTAQEYCFVSSFWERYDRLKRLFPMIGETSLLKSSHIPLWTQFGIRGYEATDWRVLYGEPTVESHYQGDPGRLALDSVHYALGIYLQHLLVRFFDRESPAYLVCLEMRRLVAKILRYANDPLHADHTFAQPSERGCHKTAILYRALSGLERAIQRLAGFPGGPSADPNAAWEDALNFDQLPFKNCGEMNLEELERERGAVESVLETYYVTFVVLNDKAGEERLKSALETVRRIFARHGVAPVIVSVPVFEFMLRFYDPYAYTGLRRYRVSRYGKDILPSIHAPSKLSFIEAILAQTQNVLAASCSRPLFVPNGGVVWLKMWSSLLDRSLRIKLYRDSGSVIPLYERLLGEYDKHYPEYSRAIRDAQTSGAEASKITPQHFELLRSAANEINGRAENRS